MHTFLPQGRLTGVGSLPHVQPDAAVEFVAAHSAAIPFWPQLPERSPDEMMIPQMLAPLRDILLQQSTTRFDVLPGRVNEFRRRLHDAEAMLDERSAAGFFAFERAAEANLFSQASAFKGQITGPITLAHCLFIDNQPLAARPDILADFIAYLIRLGEWQITRLGRFGKPVLLFIDEPVLTPWAASSAAFGGLNSLVDALRGTGVSIGIHCCAATQPDLLCSARPDILSFDAHQGLEVFLADYAVRDFVRAGGWLAFGMVPTLANVAPFDVTQAFVRWLSAAEGAFDVPRLAAQTLITATCGLGLLSIDSAHESFIKCAELAHLIQKTRQVVSR